MSKKTNIRKKPVIRDFGIQPYRKCDKDYPEVIRTPTFKAANDATVVRESEYAKPYDESEDYSGMEYPAPNWPGFGFDFPDMGLPVPDFPNMYDPWHMNFRCDLSPCWCEGQTKTFAANCTYEIVNAQFQPSEDNLSVTFSKSTISITAASGIRDGESGYLTITMKANVPKGGTLWQGKYDPVYGTHSSISVSECSDCDCTGASWDSGASATTVNPSSSCSVAVTGAEGKEKTWVVTGTGGWLDQGFTKTSLTTTADSVTIYTDASACGIIGVTACGAVGKIKCTTGQWLYDQTYAASAQPVVGCDGNGDKCWCSSGGPLVYFDIMHRVDTNGLTGGTGLEGPGECINGTSLDITYTYIADGFECTQAQIFTLVFTADPDNCNVVGCWEAANLEIWGC